MDASASLDIHVATSFLAIDPDRGSEPGIGWSWLLEISRRVSKVTAVVLPEVLDDLKSDRRLPGNVTLVSPQTVQPARSRLPIPSYYLSYAGAHAAFAEVLPELGADVCHQVNLATPYWGTELAQTPGVRVLGPVGVSVPAPLWASRHLGVSDLAMEWTRRALARYKRPPVSADAALQAADHVLAVDRLTAKRACRLGGQSTMMMADGANPASLDSTQPIDSRSHLVWVGRMMPRKACTLAVKAFGSAGRRLPADTRLLIIGDGPERPSVEREIRDLGLMNRVELLGSMSRTDVLEHVALARALAFSSLRDTFGGVVLEAAERGTPTVWASHPGVDGLRTWFPKDAGWTQPVTSASGFIDALSGGMVEAVTASPDEWLARSRNAHDFACEHGWTRRGEAMVNLYRELLEARA